MQGVCLTLYQEQPLIVLLIGPERIAAITRSFISDWKQQAFLWVFWSSVGFKLHDMVLRA